MIPETTFGSFCAFSLILTGAAAVPYFVREFHLLWSRDDEKERHLRDIEQDLAEARVRLERVMRQRVALGKLKQALTRTVDQASENLLRLQQIQH